MFPGVIKFGFDDDDWDNEYNLYPGILDMHEEV